LDNYFSILPLKQINEVDPRNWTGPYYESLAVASDDWRRPPWGVGGQASASCCPTAVHRCTTARL